MIVLSYGAKKTLLQKKMPYLKACTIRLYQNDITPNGSETSASFTECNFPGYLAELLDDFGGVYLNASDQAESDTGNHTFTCSITTTGNNIYGWYVTDANGYYVMAERLVSAPFLMNRPGQTYTVVINFLEDTYVVC